METKEWRFTDKSGWGDGPWQDEPDKVQWVDEATRYPCIIRRSPNMGSWCGYVGVPEGHPAYDKHYRDVQVEIHGGGLTFAAPCDPEEGEEAICHVKAPDEPEAFWLGFDCGHGFDYSPAFVARDKAWCAERGDDYSVFERIYGATKYRDQAYAIAETVALAAQLKAMDA